MVTIDKTNKPESFLELYQRANPLPGARAKVPLLEIISSSEEEIVLCESTVITEFIATALQSSDNQLLPSSLEDRAKVRLFTELCGSTFSNYLHFSRVQNAQQVETEFSNLQEQMKQVDAFLTASSSTQQAPFLMGNQFTLAEVHMAPFVQRCCGILPPPYDPISICKQLKLDHLQPWIQALLERESVVATACVEEVQISREKLIKRLARIQTKVAADEQ